MGGEFHGEPLSQLLYCYFNMSILEMFQSLSSAMIVAFILSSIFLCLLYKSNQNHRLPPSPPSLPIIGHLHHLGPLIHQSFHNLSSRYGPLIHLSLGSVPCVVVSTPDLVRDFLKTNELAFSSRNLSLAIKHITYDGLAMAFSPYGPYWRFIKKLSHSRVTWQPKSLPFQSHSNPRSSRASSNNNGEIK